MEEERHWNSSQIISCTQYLLGSLTNPNYVKCVARLAQYNPCKIKRNNKSVWREACQHLAAAFISCVLSWHGLHVSASYFSFYSFSFPEIIFFHMPQDSVTGDGMVFDVNVSVPFFNHGTVHKKLCLCVLTWVIAKPCHRFSLI